MSKNADTAARTPKQTLAAHLAEWHQRIKLAKSATLADLQRAHGSDHHHYKGNHFHAYPEKPINPGPDNRPPGWKTGLNVQQYDGTRRMTVTPTPGMRFLHSRQITSTSSPRSPGGAVPEECVVTAVRSGWVYFRNSTGFKSKVPV